MPNVDALCDHINNDDGYNYDMYGYCPKYKKDIRFITVDNYSDIFESIFGEEEK